MTELLFALIIGLIGAEIHVCLPAFARWIVRRRAAKLPAGLRERMEEEWLAEVAACPSHIQKVVFALGFFKGMPDLVRAHGERKVSSGHGEAKLTLGGSGTGSAESVAPESGAAQISGHAQTVIRVSDAVVATMHEAVLTAGGHSTVRGEGASTLANEQLSGGGHIASTAQLFPPSVTSHPPPSRRSD